MNNCIKLVSLAAALLMSSSLCFAAPGQTKGSYVIDKTKKLFDHGGSTAGAKMWTDGYIKASHNNSKSYQRTRSNSDLEVSFLKRKYRVIDSIAHSKHWVDPKTTRWEIDSNIKVLGRTITSRKCKQTTNKHYCESNFPSLKKTFFKAQASYPISIFTLTIKGEALGKANMRARADRVKSNNSTKWVESTSALVYSSAGVDGKASVSAGIPWLGSGGVTTSVNIITGAIKTKSKNSRSEYWKNSSSKKVRYNGNSKSTASASLGSGKVTLWVKAVGIKVVDKVVASWKGKRIGSKTLFSSTKDEYFAKK